MREGRFPRLRRLSLDHNQLHDDAMRSLATALATPTDLGAARLGLDELYVECTPAEEAPTRAVQVHFPIDEDETGARVAPNLSARDVCEKVSVSMYKGIGGCVLM